MAITFRTAATHANPDAGSATRNVNLPSGITAGDLLVLYGQLGQVSGNYATVTTPTGWTAVATAVQYAFDTSVMFYKVASGSEGATVPVAISQAGSYTDWLALRFDGNDQSTPFDVAATATPASTNTPASASITTGRANNLVVTGFGSTQSSLGSRTPPTGETERATVDNDMVINSEIQAGAGSTGAKTQTFTGASGYHAWIASFNVAGAGGTLSTAVLNTGASAIPTSQVRRVNFTASGSTWLTTAPTITPSAGSLGAITVDSDTTAHANYTAPGSAGTTTFTLTVGGSGTATLSVVAPSIARNPTKLVTGETGYKIALTGTNTFWSADTPTFVRTSGGTGASITSQSIASDTSAEIVVTAGSAAATLLVTDPSTGATFTLTVVSASGGSARRSFQ